MKNWAWIFGTAAIGMPALIIRLGGIDIGPERDAVLFGLAILGAAFLLAWAAEAAELDVPRTVAVALLAIIAVLPEYAVDIFFAWTAADNPENLAFAAANMTGANRLLIGIGWPMVVFLFWFKVRKRGFNLQLARSNSIELSVLLIATLYSFIIFTKGSLHIVDSAILLSFFLFYMWMVLRGPVEEPELVGPSATLGALRPWTRRSVVALIFAYAAFVIILAAKPFAEGLVETGKSLGVDEFILVQWLAPLASEAPEGIIAAIFALRGNVQNAMGILISSKVNQWTLLVASLPVAYNVSLGSVTNMNLDSRQLEEFLLTSAQSLFAVILLTKLRISLKGVAILFLLFSTQLGFISETARYIYILIYLSLTLFLLLGDKERIRSLFGLIPQALKEARSGAR